MASSSVDYLVIGAGTAGCVLAARLSENKDVRVALVEAGGMDTNPAIFDQSSLNPMFGLWNPAGAENWGYKTTPQSALGGRTIDIARGKVLGGSSAVNAMIYIRGNRSDFDHWASLGNTGWGYDDVLPYFKRSERYHGTQDVSFHGTDGSLSVIDYQRPSPVGNAFIEAAAQLGATNRHNDFNGADQTAGAGHYQSTKDVSGTRVTAGSAFIHPNLDRSNLSLRTGLRATKLLVENGRVTGAEFAGSEGVTTIRAERETILCGGAYETPKLLLLSGIGPAAHLAEHGIPVVADLGGVGQNLQDHLLLGVGYESLVPLDPPEMLAEAGLFKRSGLSSEQHSPDLQYFFGPVQFIAPELMIDGPGFTFAPILAQPLSRGSITLASTDPTVNARLDPNYLSREEDVALLEYGIRYARELAQTEAFKGLCGRELAPGPAIISSADLRTYIAKSAGTVWHPVGTCRMGQGADAVVDADLKVHGLANLRIADASIMPTIVNGNPNAAVMMIAEKAADLIAGAH